MLIRELKIIISQLKLIGREMFLIPQKKKDRENNERCSPSKIKVIKIHNYIIYLKKYLNYALFNEKILG